MIRQTITSKNVHGRHLHLFVYHVQNLRVAKKIAGRELLVQLGFHGVIQKDGVPQGAGGVQPSCPDLISDEGSNLSRT